MEIFWSIQTDFWIDSTKITQVDDYFVHHTIWLQCADLVTNFAKLQGLLHHTLIPFGTPLPPHGFAAPIAPHHNQSKPKHPYMPTQRMLNQMNIKATKCWH